MSNEREEPGEAGDGRPHETVRVPVVYHVSTSCCSKYYFRMYVCVSDAEQNMQVGLSEEGRRRQ